MKLLDRFRAYARQPAEKHDVVIWVVVFPILFFLVAGVLFS